MGLFLVNFELDVAIFSGFGMDFNLVDKNFQCQNYRIKSMQHFPYKNRSHHTHCYEQICIQTYK